MNLDLMVAEAKEWLHRSIGQRARYAKRELADAALGLKLRAAARTQWEIEAAGEHSVAGYARPDTIGPPSVCTPAWQGNGAKEEA